MSSQVHETSSEVTLTRRQIAARKRAARTKEVNAAAKAWLAGRKSSKTPVADRLIARYMGKGWSEVGILENLHNCLTMWSTDDSPRWEKDYIFADLVACLLVERRFTSQGKALADAMF